MEGILETELCSRLDLPEEIISEVREICERIPERERQPETAPAVICLVARRSGHPVSPRRVADEIGINRRRFLQRYWRLMRVLGISVSIPTPDVALMRIRQVGRSTLPERVLEEAREILTRYERSQGKNPRAVAAAAVYIAASRNGTRLTHRQIADVFSIAPSTVRERCKEMLITLGDESE
jgi:transcription initiation factor TFIIB